tara:strand:- start:2820 stop:3797 length:978 start_codon:yes stop_codon:yes gene_type:complete
VKKNKPIVIVAGEPNSVFLEIFFKTYKKISFKKPILLVVSKKLLLSQMKSLKYRLSFNFLEKKNMNLENLSNKKINVINIDYNFKKPFDKISYKSKKYINDCFNIGLNIIKKNNLKFLVNGPISKSHFLEKEYQGITEYLADKTNKSGDETMLIFNKELSVCPITTHDALRTIFKKITKEKIIRKVLTINKFYKNFLKVKPCFAVTGINPHCETKDKINEEKNIIVPAIKFLKKRKVIVDGPFPSDTIFLKQNLKKYNVIIGMYHDQVLSPIKAIYGFDAINITLGLPFIRISPDHGPNENMIGKNLSDPLSLIRTINFINKFEN